MSWELYYCNTDAFMRRMHLLRYGKKNFRINPKQELDPKQFRPGWNLVGPPHLGLVGVPIVRDTEVPMGLALLVDEETNKATLIQI